MQLVLWISIWLYHIQACSAEHKEQDYQKVGAEQVRVGVGWWGGRGAG